MASWSDRKKKTILKRLFVISNYAAIIGKIYNSLLTSNGNVCNMTIKSVEYERGKLVTH